MNSSGVFAMTGKTDETYWDSSIFFAWLKGEQHKVGELDEIQRQVRAFDGGNLDIYTSSITMIEICDAKLDPSQRASFDGMTRRSNFVWIEPTHQICALASQLRAEFAELKPDGTFKKVWMVPDAIHLASAVSMGLKSLITLDSEGNKKTLAMTAKSQDIKNRYQLEVSRPRSPAGQTELGI